MSEIDLIPTDYRNRRWLGRWLRKILSGAGSVIFLGAVTAGALIYQTATLEAEATRLEEQRAVTTQQRNELEQLSQKRQTLAQQLSILRGLRSGAPAETVFLTIDRAIANIDVWFVDWNFNRAGVLVPEDQSERQAWMVETHMTIRGQAQDHDALSRFVKGLFAQPAVVDVRVQKTAMRRYQNGDLVDFDLAIVLNSEARSS
jgi:cell division protein FtsB